MPKKPSPRSEKRAYKLRNWREYNTALVQRGSLTLWVEEETLAGWLAVEKSGRRGASRLYTDGAICCALTLQQVYHLPLRATEGLLQSLFGLLGVALLVPDYSTLCRRRKTLSVSLSCRRGSKPLHLVIDASGFKVYGEGEWKVRAHGGSKRRTWRKLHLAVDADTHQIVAAVVSTADVTDGEVLPQMLSGIAPEIAAVGADGAYDQARCYDAIQQKRARAIIPPRKDAHIWQHGNSKAPPHPRDENLRAIRQKGRATWKQESGYHRRSLAETAFFRIKTCFGERLSARTFEGQATELLVRCRVLNRMTQAGMPDSYAA